MKKDIDCPNCGTKLKRVLSDTDDILLCPNIKCEIGFILLKELEDD